MNAAEAFHFTVSMGCLILGTLLIAWAVERWLDDVDGI